MTLGLFLFHIRNRTIPVQVSIQGKIVAVVVAAAIACVASVSLRFPHVREPNFRAAKKRKMPRTCEKPYGNACYAGYCCYGNTSGVEVYMTLIRVEEKAPNHFSVDW